MKRECIADRGIWTAKKRYILNVWDNEGVRYEEPKLKMMGIEAVKFIYTSPCVVEYIKDCPEHHHEWHRKMMLIKFIDDTRGKG